MVVGSTLLFFNQQLHGTKLANSDCQMLKRLRLKSKGRKITSGGEGPLLTLCWEPCNKKKKKKIEKTEIFRSASSFIKILLRKFSHLWEGTNLVRDPVSLQ